MASTVVAAAARSDVPPRQPVVDPSPSSSPDNAANRSDSFNSSPNHFSDTEIQVLRFVCVRCICDSSKLIDSVKCHLFISQLELVEEMFSLSVKCCSK